MKKLQNKKTGEIVELIGYFKRKSGKPDFTIDSYDTLDQLNEEWQDYEEPKETGYWYYDTTANKLDFIENCNVSKEDKKLDKLIGNHFGTKEEAEKAVEKLKAWKRLKDKGFRFRGIGRTVYEIDCAEFDIGSEYLREIDLRGSELSKDLDLLFGGKD